MTTSTTPAEFVIIPPGQTPSPASGCAGLAGSIEIQILVGPSEVAGMEPVAVGSVPFTVTFTSGSHLVDGAGPTVLEEQVFEADWGTYTVSFDAQNTISGTCEPNDDTATLSLTVATDGEQMVNVRSEGLVADYPWEGTRTLDVVLPVEEGARQSGEGWIVVLHLS